MGLDLRNLESRSTGYSIEIHLIDRHAGQEETVEKDERREMREITIIPSEERERNERKRE